MSQNTKKILKFLFFFLLIFFFMYLAFKDISFSELLEELKKTNYFWAIIGSLIGVLIGGAIRAYRWRYFLNPIKKDIGFQNLFSSMMIGYMMNSIVPKSGEISRPVIIAKMEDISKAASFGTIIVERVFDMLSLLISFGFCLFFFKAEISLAFEGYNLEQYALYASIIVLIIVLVMILMIFNLEKSERIINKLTVKFLPERFQEKIHKIFISLINGFLFIRNPRSYFMIGVLTVLLWTSYVVSAYVSFWAVGINLTIFDANFLLTIITFTLVLPLPGNSAGAYHFFCTAVLVSYGINRETALTYATITHLLNFIFLVGIGFYYSIKENIKLKDKL